MNKKRGALELSTTFIIGIIIGVVLFSMGLILVYKIVVTADSVDDLGPDRIKLYKDNCIQKGSRVCVPVTKNELRISEKGIFPVVIINNVREKKTFKLNVEFSTSDTKDGSNPIINFDDWSFTDFRELELENNQNDLIQVAVFPPGGTKKGTYIFNINVCFNADVNPDQSKCPSTHRSLYSPTQQITVEVK